MLISFLGQKRLLERGFLCLGLFQAFQLNFLTDNAKISPGPSPFSHVALLLGHNFSGRLCHCKPRQHPCRAKPQEGHPEDFVIEEGQRADMSCILWRTLEQIDNKRLKQNNRLRIHLAVSFKQMGPSEKWLVDTNPAYMMSTIGCPGLSFIPISHRSETLVSD